MVRNDSEIKKQLDPNTNWVNEKLDSLAPDSTPPVQAARVKLNSRISEKEANMWQNIFGGKYRIAWAALMMVVMVTALLSFPQVRVIANSFLGLFRVEQIEAVDVGISLDNLPNELESRYTAVDDLIADQLIIEQEVMPLQVAYLDEASQLAGFQARMPTSPEGEKAIVFQDSTTVRLVIDTERWNALLEGMGYKDFQLPKSVNGEEVIFNLPKAVIIGIGDCERNEINEIKTASPGTNNCTIFMQSETPSIEAPPGVDINRVGQILLQTLGMSEAEAEAFSTTVNWATTLVVPVPSDVDYRKITIEGVDGIYLEDRYDGGKGVYSLLWVKDGILHALIGDGTLTEALRSVKSLE